MLKSRIFIYIICIIFFIYGIFCYSLCKNLSVFDVDDLNSTLDSYPVLYEENGRYICNFLSRVVGVYIPNLFNIHLQNSMNTIGAFFYILIIFSLILSIARFILLKEPKNSLLFLSAIFIPMFAFTYYAFQSVPFYITIYSFQYGYVLATVFGFCFCIWFMITYSTTEQILKNILL